MTSEELFKGCRENGEEAWTYAYNYLISFLQKKFPSDPRIKDLAHDTVLYFMDRGVQEVQNPGAFMMLLRLKATGLFIDRWRLEKAHVFEPLEIEDNEGDVRANPSIPSYRFAPEDALSIKQAVLVLQKAIKTLSQKCRETLRRYFSARVKGQKVKELAQEMGLEYNALRTEIHRCHEKLKQNQAYREILDQWR
jgi:RNA polymerase sigma factor (sigma-70 family)